MVTPGQVWLLQTNTLDNVKKISKPMNLPSVLLTWENCIYKFELKSVYIDLVQHKRSQLCIQLCILHLQNFFSMHTIS